MFVQDLKYREVLLNNEFVFGLVEEFKFLKVGREDGGGFPGLEGLEEGFGSEDREVSLDVLLLFLFSLIESANFPEGEFECEFIEFLDPLEVFTGFDKFKEVSCL